MTTAAATIATINPALLFFFPLVCLGAAFADLEADFGADFALAETLFPVLLGALLAGTLLASTLTGAGLFTDSPLLTGTSAVFLTSVEYLDGA
jgi:hypothetical protein